MLWVSPPARAEQQQERTPRELSLKDALRIAAEHSPVLAQSQAQADAADGRTTQARSVLLPQITATASYARQHGAGSQLGLGTFSANASGTYNRFAFGAAATQTLWDYEAIERLRAAGLSFDAARATARASQLQTALNVRTLFFEARAARALIGVQQAAFENQQLNLNEVDAFVKVGVRPEIDLLQAQTDLANARVALLSARNQYGLAKASLRQAIGLRDADDFDVTDDTLPELNQENRALPILVQDALSHRPELESLKHERAAAEATLSAAKGTYWPTLQANAGVTEAGQEPSQLGTNWTVGVALTWPLFQGGLSNGMVDEARALSAVQQSQFDIVALQVQYDVEQARSTIENTQASLSAADEALRLAKSQLEQAQARYRQGISSIIELRDAQFGLTSASAQLVQAQLNLYRARAQLMAALGQEA
ncbi:MAG TPA: TolC family protein [Polyangiales bacterium]|nr:TolC family protein [Polyangiales bacterium]